MTSSSENGVPGDHVGREPFTSRRRAVRLSTAVAVAVAAVATMFVGWGSPTPAETGTQPWSLGPQPAGALTTAEQTQGGATEIRFLHPTADPERIRAELQQHGFDIDVTFVPADPFSVGTLVMYEGNNGIETIHEGTDLTGGGFGHDVGIVVPSDWAGSAHLGIGREALDGALRQQRCAERRTPRRADALHRNPSPAGLRGRATRHRPRVHGGVAHTEAYSRVSPAPLEPQDESEAADAVVDARRLRRQLNAALAGIAARDREALLLQVRQAGLISEPGR